MTFEELGVSAPICQAVRELGYEQPMPVQEAVTPYLLGAPIDLIALAQTGTGKTAAFGYPLLQNVERSLQAQPNDGVATPRALVLCPTRELCLQIADDLTGLVASTSPSGTHSPRLWGLVHRGTDTHASPWCRGHRRHSWAPH